jgi:hypothetical protein
MNTTGKHGFRTEVEFDLPKGYVDGEGVLHRHGVMRLATAADEILPLRDPRVQQNEAYFTVIVLSRVITQLGSLADIHTGVIEGLFAADLAYLQRLYERINAVEAEDFDRPPAHKPSLNGRAAPRLAALGEA